MGAVVAGVRRLAVLMLAVLLLLTAAAPARAETTGPRQADVVLLLDRSGSMAANDPGGLAVTGARVFLDMLDPKDRVAVVTFDAGARTLFPLTEVGSGAEARQALESLGRPTGEWTDMRAALEAALNLLPPASADRQPAVLLFTDGKPETQPGGVPDGYRAEMLAAATSLGGRQAPVFSIGLGQADLELLQQVALYTKAESFSASSADQVVKLFADVLGRIKGRHVALSFSEDLAPGVAGQPRTFTVPPYTRLLTLSAAGGTGPVALTGQMPGGGALQSAPGLKFSQGGNYTVYTIPDPVPGTWTVQLAGAGRVEGHAQTESALRLRLLNPPPYSQVGTTGPIEVTVDGDPDAASPLEVWAQAGTGQPVKLTPTEGHHIGELDMADGRLAVWATRAGAEVARQEFRVYPDMALNVTLTKVQHFGKPAPWWRTPLIALAGVASVTALLLGLGALNWRRMQRRDGVLTGRLGTHSLEGRGREQRIGDLARLEARLVARTWPPLHGLYLGRPELQIYIRPLPDVRCEINDRPPGDGRLYHGDEVTLGGETLRFHNPRVARRPAAPRPPRVPRGPKAPGGRPTFRG
jgi:uncharacterized protein YegL